MKGREKISVAQLKDKSILSENQLEECMCEVGPSGTYDGWCTVETCVHCTV